MPSQTPRQHRAMEAAAHGRSTLGIPPKVGRDFVAADKREKEREPDADDRRPKPKAKGKRKGIGDALTKFSGY